MCAHSLSKLTQVMSKIQDDGTVHLAPFKEDARYPEARYFLYNDQRCPHRKPWRECGPAENCFAHHHEVISITQVLTHVGGGLPRETAFAPRRRGGAEPLEEIDSSRPNRSIKYALEPRDRQLAVNVLSTDEANGYHRDPF